MRNGYDIVAVGHISHDVEKHGERVTWFTGGGAYFSAFAARAAGARVLVVTRMGAGHPEPEAELQAAGIAAVTLPGRTTTSIENVYEAEDLDRRRVRLLSQADPFRLEEIPDRPASIYSLTGLFRGEIPDELIPALAERARVALDLQGVLRTSRGGSFSWEDWPEKRRYLPLITYLKADSLESAVVTGSRDRRQAARMLHDWGAREVMVTHSSEVLVYDGSDFHAAPFTARNLSGRTGRGDTCFGSYLSWRLDHPADESVRYAAALTSMKMESPGPFRESLQAVLARMQAEGGRTT